ncbi:C3HC zinc finger-like-domain-containing protein [Schizophyllum fasciatum]
MSAIPSISSPIPQTSANGEDFRTASTHRATKRKLDDAFARLDTAIGQEDERPPPPKRANTSSSFLTTLSRYGIMSKPKTKILSRAKSTFKPSTTSTIAPHAAYRPSSVAAFLERLATFKIATYSGKPKPLEASAAAAAGWINDGKDRLVCGICNASWVVVGREGLSRDAANVLVEKQCASLVDAHKEGCPWRKQQCDATIYRIPLQSPQTMVRAIKSNALALTTPFADVHVKHPLSSTQLHSLKQTVANFALPASDGATPTIPSQPPCEAAILASLFGWSTPAAADRPPSLSRATSSTRRTPSLSRSASRAATPAPASASRPGTPTASARYSAFLPLASSSLSIALGTGGGAGDVVHCALCQRRVGLWAFRASKAAASGEGAEGGSSLSPDEARAPPTRQFDLLKEHRAFCPYVVQSTVVPSMQVAPTEGSGLSRSATTGSAFEHHRKTGSTSSLADPNAPVEGWRAVLTIVLRYGASRRQRERIEEGVEAGLALQFGAGGGAQEGQAEAEGDAMSVDSTGVESMVADVKKRGGRELLKYVKGLIG